MTDIPDFVDTISSFDQAADVALDLADLFRRAHVGVLLDRAGCVLLAAAHLAARDGLEDVLTWARSQVPTLPRLAHLLVVSVGRDDVLGPLRLDILRFRLARLALFTSGVTVLDWLQVEGTNMRSVAILADGMRAWTPHLFEVGSGDRREHRPRPMNVCEDIQMDTADSRSVVEQFWGALYDRDWERIASFFSEDAAYTDMPSPEDDVAVGPDQIVARLRLGIEPISGYVHELRLMVVEGSSVVTEHAETWTWHTGESVTLPFVSVQELRDGKIVRWFDYWDLQTLMNAAPQWWIEHVMHGWAPVDT